MTGRVFLLPLIVCAAGLASCADYSSSSSPVSDRMMNALRAQLHDPGDFGVQYEKDRVRMVSSSTAPEVVRVPLLLHGDRLPLISVSVNGHAGRSFVLDTGSQCTVMEARTAVGDKVKLLRHEGVDFSLRGVAGAEPAMLGVPSSLDIGVWRLSNVPCMVRTHENPGAFRFVDSGGGAFDILGMDVLRRIGGYVTIDYPHHEVVFGNDSFFKPSIRKNWRIPLKFDRRLPRAKFITNGVSWTALIDTGANSMVELSRETAQKLGALQKAAPFTGARTGFGHEGTSNLGVVRMSRFDGLGPKLANVDAVIVGDFNKIGSGVLRPFRVTFDFKRSLLWIEDPR